MWIAPVEAVALTDKPATPTGPPDTVSATVKIPMLELEYTLTHLCLASLKKDSTQKSIYINFNVLNEQGRVNVRMKFP